MHLAIAELPASAGLFLVPALHLGLLRDGFLVGNLRRVKRYLDVKSVGEFCDHRFDMKLAGT